MTHLVHSNRVVVHILAFQHDAHGLSPTLSLKQNSVSAEQLQLVHLQAGGLQRKLGRGQREESGRREQGEGEKPKCIKLNGSSTAAGLVSREAVRQRSMPEHSHTSGSFKCRQRTLASLSCTTELSSCVASSTTSRLAARARGRTPPGAKTSSSVAWDESFFGSAAPSFFLHNSHIHVATIRQRSGQCSLKR